MPAEAVQQSLLNSTRRKIARGYAEMAVRRRLADLEDKVALKVVANRQALEEERDMLCMWLTENSK